MAQYMLLLHQAPNYNADLPREKMLEMTKRYMAWADALRQKGRMVGGEKLAAGGVRHIRVKDGKPAVVVATNDAARERGLSANTLVRAACAELGGSGGGKDDVAQGGGTDVSGVDRALTAIRNGLG